MTPMSAELSFLKESLIKKSSRFQTRQTGRWVVHFFEDMNMALAQGGHGKVEFAIHAMHGLQSGDYRGLCCVGGAGALDGRLKPLDLVVSEVTIEHDRIVKFMTKAPPEFPGNPAWLEKLRLGHFPRPIHFGRIASGDEDVTDIVRAQAIRESTQALCVAWEGAGGARACQFLNLPFIEIRAITDLSNATAMRDYKESLKVAMHSLGELIVKL